MKKENTLVIALICIAFTGVMIHNHIKEGGAGETALKKTSAQGSKDANIQWKEYTEGMKMAKSRNKPVFLYFHAEWCTYCKKMESTTFKDEKISAYLNENFISISIDTDKDTEISNQWKVRGLPTIWFLKPDGTKLDNLPGYVDEEYLSKVLAYIHSGTYEKMSFNQFLEKEKSK
jgi:thioredoxin-related protein